MAWTLSSHLSWAGIFLKGLALPHTTWQGPGEAVRGLCPELLDSACQVPVAWAASLPVGSDGAARQRDCHSADANSHRYPVTGHCPQPSPRKSSTNDLYKLLLHVLFITANTFLWVRPCAASAHVHALGAGGGLVGEDPVVRLPQGVENSGFLLPLTSCVSLGKTLLPSGPCFPPVCSRDHGSAHCRAGGWG